MPGLHPFVLLHVPQTTLSWADHSDRILLVFEPGHPYPSLTEFGILTQRCIPLPTYSYVDQQPDLGQTFQGILTSTRCHH